MASKVSQGLMFRYQYCLVGGLEAIVFGSLRWCVWSFRPSSPLRLPHLKCLLLITARIAHHRSQGVGGGCLEPPLLSPPPPSPPARPRGGWGGGLWTPPPAVRRQECYLESQFTIIARLATAGPHSPSPPLCFIPCASTRVTPWCL